LWELVSLHQAGLLTDNEFRAAKARLLDPWGAKRRLPSARSEASTRPAQREPTTHEHPSEGLVHIWRGCSAPTGEQRSSPLAWAAVRAPDVASPASATPGTGQGLGGRHRSGTGLASVDHGLGQ